MTGRFDDLPVDEPYPGVMRRTFDGSHATVTSYRFTAGASFPMHRHPQEQITLIESGAVQMTIGDESHSIAAGGWSIVPPDIEHGIVAGAEGAGVLAIITPRRASADAYTVVS